MSYTRQQWALAFLAALGNTHPTQPVVDWVVGWSVHETTTGQGATYNLLNTTQRAAGSTQFNGVGVQNFTSFAQGVQTNALVLHQNFVGYSSLLQALRNNDIASLSAPAPGVQTGLKTWCGGCGYGVGFQGLGAVHRNDQFPGQASGGGGSVGSQIFIPPPAPQQQATSGNGGGTISPAKGGTTTATNQNQSSSGGPDPFGLGGLANVLVQFFAPFKAIGDFFGTLGPWVSNPIRIVKLVLGIVLIIVAILAALGGLLNSIGKSPQGKAAVSAVKAAAV